MNSIAYTAHLSVHVFMTSMNVFTNSIYACIFLLIYPQSIFTLSILAAKQQVACMYEHRLCIYMLGLYIHDSHCDTTTVGIACMYSYNNAVPTNRIPVVSSTGLSTILQIQSFEQQLSLLVEVHVFVDHFRAIGIDRHTMQQQRQL